MISEEYILPENIKNLLSRYYDGMTSLEEEKYLKKYLSEHHVSESLLADQTILSFTKPEEVSLFPANEIWAKIKQNEYKKKNNWRVIGVVSSIAASLLILISVGTWYFWLPVKQVTFGSDTYSNPKEAYMVVQKYLGFASSKLSYAYTEIKPIEKLTIPSEAMQPFLDIEKNLQRLNQLNRINSTTRKLEHFSIITELMEADKN